MVLPDQRCWLNGAAWGWPDFPPAECAPQRLGTEGGCLRLPWLPSWLLLGRVPAHSGLRSGGQGDPDTTLLSQAAQNLIVLAREEAGAEKIFQSDGVRLLTQLLDTAKADLMLAALRTLVGLCSGHRSRVGPTIARLSCVIAPSPGEIDVREAVKGVRQGRVTDLCLWLAAALLSRGALSCHLPGWSL